MCFQRFVISVAVVSFLVVSPVVGQNAVSQPKDTVVQVANIFAAHACLTSDPVFCPGGVFNQTAFDQMYADPASFPDHYPNGQAGPYTRAFVPTCETPGCAEEIRCTDGTRPLFYVKPGNGPDADKWIIRIQVGGKQCSNNCASLYLSGEAEHFSSAFGENGDRRNANGILSDDPPPRNSFGNYTTVFLDKCVGDKNLGDITVLDAEYLPNTTPGLTGPMYFHGFRVIQALLQGLKDLPGAAPDLQDAELIAFMTNSNGSNGAYLYIDRLRDYILSEIAAPGNHPDVRLLASSYNRPTPEVEYAMLAPGFRSAEPGPPKAERGRLGTINYLDAYGHVDDATTSSTACGEEFDPSQPSYEDWMDNGRKVTGAVTCIHGAPGEVKDHERGIGGMFFSTADYQAGTEFNSLSNWGAIDATPTVDQSCLDAHSATGDAAACNDSLHVMVFHLTTPTFFAQQTADRTIRTDKLHPFTRIFDPAQCDTGDPNCHSENFRGEVDADGVPIASIGALHKDDMRDRTLLIAQEIFAGASLHQEPALGIDHGAFIDNTVDHMGLSNFSKLRRSMQASAQSQPAELQHYLRAWLDPAATEPVVCVDDGLLYDAEAAPPVAFADVPPGLECDTGFYQPANPNLDDDQACLDPYANTAMPAYQCPAMDLLFRDGFESGDVSLWSAGSH